MNRKRRTLIASAKPLLSKAASIIEMAAEQEGDCMDNVPENLQGTDRYETMENVVDGLESALEHIENALDHIEEAQNCIDEVIHM